MSPVNLSGGTPQYQYHVTPAHPGDFLGHLLAPAWEFVDALPLTMPTLPTGPFEVRSQHQKVGIVYIDIDL